MASDSIVNRWRAWAPQFLSLLRIAAGFLFIQYGSTKLFALPGPLMPDGGTVPPLSLAGIAGILELAGGILLLFGLFTRPTAFILSGEMAVAYWHAHAPRGTWPVLNQGAPAFTFCFLFLYLSAAGGGPWSRFSSQYATSQSGGVDPAMLVRASDGVSTCLPKLACGSLG